MFGSRTVPGLDPSSDLVYSVYLKKTSNIFKIKVYLHQSELNLSCLNTSLNEAKRPRAKELTQAYSVISVDPQQFIPETQTVNLCLSPAQRTHWEWGLLLKLTFPHEHTCVWGSQLDMFCSKPSSSESRVRSCFRQVCRLSNDESSSDPELLWVSDAASRAQWILLSRAAHILNHVKKKNTSVKNNKELKGLILDPLHFLLIPVDL